MNRPTHQYPVVIMKVSGRKMKPITVHIGVQVASDRLLEGPDGAGLSEVVLTLDFGEQTPKASCKCPTQLLNELRGHTLYPVRLYHKPNGIAPTKIKIGGMWRKLEAV